MLLRHFFSRTKAYHFLIMLLCSILLGALTGHILGPSANKLKPLGDIFLNLMFTAVVPLVFFSVASAIASIGELKKVWQVIASTLGTFLFTGLCAALFMLVIVKCFPPGHGAVIPLAMPHDVHQAELGRQLVDMFTVTDFIKLFSRDNMLALIFFAGLIGIATLSIGPKGKLMAEFLQSGAEIVMKVVSYIMYYAPIGFFAYFAVLVGELGPKLLSTYLHATLVYYFAALGYFIFAFSFYAYLAANRQGVKIFWRHIFLPATTALATCSSAASIPANLQGTKKMRVPAYIYELVVPLGAIVHKDGSVLGGMVKIAFLFAIFNMNFSSPSTLLLAVVISLLVGTVMGAIPGGGMIGEMLILSVYGFPPQALIIIAAISMIIDPPATLLNVTCNSVSSMLVARLVEGKKWLEASSRI
jgi:Na+/H+-dicarboxylate symporter